MINKKEFSNIDEYINKFPKDVQIKLHQLRQVIKNATPEVIETISYQMPAFKTNEILVYFAAYKNHIGFYPTPSAMVVFKDELSKYKTSKGAIQFPLNETLPIELITQIVKFRAKESKK
ncbi:MAG: DUF1801 domain-containing protein [Bacilli bacterium]|nr:DUF1801 domain-containing protein [Bacilli bacterium]